ncbi:MAG: SDR family oxidoreductase [Anaerolineales bacterium]
MGNKLKDKTAIITGASAGIGWASALALAEEGANLVMTARRKDRLEALEILIKERGGKAVSVIGDARAEDGNYKNLIDTSAEDYDEMMDTNMRSTFLFSRYAVPVMIEQGSGTILMISSVAGLYGFAGEAIYCATKFAQVGFAQALDNELRPHGIKVGVICPGGVKTEFALGKGRTEEGVAQSGMLEPDDVAGAVLLACTQSLSSRIVEVRMRPMDEPLF